MKHSLLIFLSSLFLSISATAKGTSPMKIKLSFADKNVIIALSDNKATQQFLRMLPAEFVFEDFAHQEKISYFPQAISLQDVSGGMIARKGKMFIYKPWGNFGIFYKEVGNRPDSSLIELGQVESGIEYLEEQKTDFRATLEIIPEE